MMSEENIIIELEDVVAGYYVAGTGLKSLRKKFVPVLKEVSVKVRDGERVAIIGESGSGKTTLLKVILGILKPLKGSVKVFGKDIYKISHRERLKILRQIGFVPQDPYRALDPSLEIRYSLIEPLEAMGSKNPLERAREVLKLVRLPEKVLELYPQDLSGGMRQRILIARAIIHDPEILILDEPTSALDVSTQAQIINLILELYTKLRFTLLVVTHDLGVAQYLAERAVIFKDGKVVEEGNLLELLTQPSHPYTKLLIESYKLPG